MRNKRDVEMLTNACFSALNHAEGLMSSEQSIKSKTSKINTLENKAVIVLDQPGNRSRAFDIKKSYCFNFLIVYQFQLQLTLLNGTFVLLSFLLILVTTYSHSVN